jgi:hypothetical protein
MTTTTTPYNNHKQFSFTLLGYASVKIDIICYHYHFSHILYKLNRILTNKWILCAFFLILMKESSVQEYVYLIS